MAAVVGIAEQGNRLRVVHRLADALERVAGEHRIPLTDLADHAAELDEEGWTYVAALADRKGKVPSPATRRLTVVELRLRHPEVEPDPFDGLPGVA